MDRAWSPALHTAESTSCATCHAANGAVKWVERNTTTAPTRARVVSAQDLTSPSDPFDTRSQTARAFGYQDRTPAVSQRTIAETAVLVGRFAEIGR